MSADLFAEFGSFSQTAQPVSQSSTAATSKPPPSAADPFSFLAPAPAPSQPLSQLQPWPSLPTQSTSSFDDSSWASLTQPDAGTRQAKGEDDDAWGDFEVASPVQEAPAPPLPPALTAFSARPAPAVSSNHPVRTRVIRASTLDLMTNNLVDFGLSPASNLAPVDEAPVWAKQAKKSPPPKPKNTDPNVLFDADDFDADHPPATEDDDDDFGEFETIAPPVKAPAPAPSLDIFSLDWSTPAPAPSSAGMSSTQGARKEPPSQLLATLGLGLGDSSHYPSPPKSPSFQERNPFPGLAVTTPKASEFAPDTKEPTTSPVTAWPSLDQQSANQAREAGSAGGWGAFEDFPAEKTGSAAKEAPGWDWDAVDAVPEPRSQPISNTASQEPPPDWSWGDSSSPTAPAQAPSSRHAPSIPDDAPPPTNIPPPSVLLSLFPPLLSLPSAALFKPTAGQPPALKSRVLSDPAAVAFLRAYLALATVAGRVLAGRRLRWTRDRFLSQAMTISAAAGAGVKTGLKLAGVDRAQAARDEREAADVLAAWKAQVGPLRGAVAAANSSSSAGPPLRVPKLAEDMAVSVVKTAPKAPRQCLVCGLHRQERLEGVDFDVEDSFGEWWVEHWGHRACRNFWVEHEKSLRSR